LRQWWDKYTRAWGVGMGRADLPGGERIKKKLWDAVRAGH
jgi:hypothetical protein